MSPRAWTVVNLIRHLLEFFRRSEQYLNATNSPFSLTDRKKERRMVLRAGWRARQIDRQTAIGMSRSTIRSSIPAFWNWVRISCSSSSSRYYNYLLSGPPTPLSNSWAKLPDNFLKVHCCCCNCRQLASAACRYVHLSPLEQLARAEQL